MKVEDPEAYQLWKTKQNASKQLWQEKNGVKPKTLRAIPLTEE